MRDSLLKKIYTTEKFQEDGEKILSLVIAHIKNTTSGTNSKTLNWNTPENELQFWRDFLKNGDTDDFFSEIIKRTTHTHHPKYMGHQVGVTAPITMLTGILLSLIHISEPTRPY